jgi:REP-associated tyrosine transposase
MPNYVRWREKGASYFFTVVTHRRRPIFRDASARGLLNRAFVHARRKMPFDMFACVLLPDHLHCIWTVPEGDDGFPARWGSIKRYFTHHYLRGGNSELSVSASRKKRRERGVWQRRYWEHRIRDETDWFRLRDDIHLNPVKHEYVDRPEDWPWSSFHRHVRLGWLDAMWPGSSAIDTDIEVGE